MDILDLFVPLLAASKNEYGKDTVPPLPLSIDRVMENRHFKSAAPLLQLAPEVLAIILSYVSSDSLGCLALVNSDCRQLARSRQFASVSFDYSDASLHLIRLLLEEKLARLQSNKEISGGVGGAIGPCIRRLTVATNAQWITHRHDVELSDEFNELEKSIRDERLARASDAFSEYLTCIESILSSNATLPHLELLDWRDRVTLPQSFFQALTTSSIQHLKLFRVSVSEEFEIVQPPVSDRWNLRTLNIDILWSLKGERVWLTSPFCTSLLRSCSHSLESLVWSHIMREKYTFGSDPAKVPRFERLRNLRLAFLDFNDMSTVNGLLESHLCALSLEYSLNSLVGEALRTRGRIPSLETLSFSLRKQSIDNYLQFLKSNTQISKLTILGAIKGEELNGDVLVEKILPVLSLSFHALKSLRLSWGEKLNIIPDVALQIISGLKGLEQICLGAGCAVGWKHDWLVDHEAVRNHLSNMPRLKKIAFTRDSYNHPQWLGENNHDRYYFDRFLSQDEMNAAGVNWGSGEALDQAWEDWHRKRMVLEAQKYVTSMPKLEWIFLGQYPMAVVKGPEQKRNAVLLCDERDSCDTLLNRMFGWEGLV